MATEPSFDVVESGDAGTGTQLVFGVSHLGMAGVSAANYLVEQLDVALAGHVATTGFPAIAPFEDGEPRHPMQLFTSEDDDVTIFVGELFVPVWAAEAFADGFLEWVRDAGFEEVSVLYGVPFPHGTEQHRVFYAATEEFRERRLADTDIEPLVGGFLDGVVAEIVVRALDGNAPPTGVFITPTHPPGPDLDAALLLLDAMDEVYGVRVDERDLRESAREMKQYYSELASRMETLSRGEQPLSGRDYPEDRMFM